MQIEFNISRDMEEKRKRGREIEGKMGRRIDKIEKTEQSIYSRSSASGLYGEREEEEKKGEKQELFLTIFVQEKKIKIKIFKRRMFYSRI